MENAGVTIMSMFSIFGELMRDWRNTPGAKEAVPFFNT
jgi:hypothetical protein